MSGLLFPALRVLVDKPPTQEERAAIQYDIHKWPGAEGALKELIEAGCDHGELETLLVRLRRALGTTPWSKADLFEAADLFDRSAKTLLNLKEWGEARNLCLSDDSERWLLERYADLQRLAARLRERAPRADKRDNRRLGRARARLIAYVMQKTATPHYAPLALLISVATHKDWKVTIKDYDPDTLRKWWANNSKKYAAVLTHD